MNKSSEDFHKAIDFLLSEAGQIKYRQLAREIADLHDRKQADYGTGDDPFANLRASEGFGIPPWIGAVVRLNDKVTRLKSLIINGKLENESAEDSMLDIAVYALIAKVLYAETY